MSSVFFVPYQDLPLQTTTLLPCLTTNFCRGLVITFTFKFYYCIKGPGFVCGSCSINNTSSCRSSSGSTSCLFCQRSWKPENCRWTGKLPSRTSFPSFWCTESSDGETVLYILYIYIYYLLQINRCPRIGSGLSCWVINKNNIK